MTRAKLFDNGGSQAVRLPKEFRFDGKEVTISKLGRGVLLEPVETDWASFWAEIDRLRGDDELVRAPQPQWPERDYGFQTLSLDTNVLIDLANRQIDRLRRRLEEALQSGERIATCSIAAHELVYGAVISPRPQHHLDIAHQILGKLEVAELSFEDVERAAYVRADLRRLGQPIGSFDTFIAGQALERGWTVVTANIREFGRVPGLSVIDWTAAESP